MKIDKNKPVEVQDYLIRKIQDIELKYGNKIDFDFYNKSSLDYLYQINPVKYKTPQFCNYNYDSLLRSCCLSISTETRFLPSDRKNLPDLWIHVRNCKEFQDICISKLSIKQLNALDAMLFLEHINIEIMRKKSVIDRLIVDFFRDERALSYSNHVRILKNNTY